MLMQQLRLRHELTNLEASINDTNQITGDVESPLQLSYGALHVAAGQGLGKVSKGQGGQEHLRKSAERRIGWPLSYLFEVPFQVCSLHSSSQHLHVIMPPLKKRKNDIFIEGSSVKGKFLIPGLRVGCDTHMGGLRLIWCKLFQKCLIIIYVATYERS